MCILKCFSLGWSPNPRNIKYQIKCSQCRTLSVEHSASEARDLKKIINGMDDFTCVCDISGDLTEALKVKGVSINRNMQCFFFFSFSKWGEKIRGSKISAPAAGFSNDLIKDAVGLH